MINSTPAKPASARSVPSGRFRGVVLPLLDDLAQTGAEALSETVREARDQISPAPSSVSPPPVTSSSGTRTCTPPADGGFSADGSFRASPAQAAER